METGNGSFIQLIYDAIRLQSMRLIPALHRTEICFEFEFILVVIVVFLGEVRSSVGATQLYHVEVVGLWIDATHPLALPQIFYPNARALAE